MTTADLPATAQVDVGLIGFVFLVLILGATLASLVYAAVQERRAGRLTEDQLDRSREIAHTRREHYGAMPFPLDHPEAWPAVTITDPPDDDHRWTVASVVQAVVIAGVVAFLLGLYVGAPDDPMPPASPAPQVTVPDHTIEVAP